MISLRLPPALEELLHLFSMTTGIPKNTLITQAVQKLIENHNLSEIPLNEEIQERRFDLLQYEQMLRDKGGKKMYELLDELFTSTRIWTKKSGGSTGEITPGIYGRNTIVGYAVHSGFDDPVIISRHHSNHGFGPLINYKLELTSLKDWRNYMRPVALQP